LSIKNCVMSTRRAQSFDHTSVFGIPSQHEETVTTVTLYYIIHTRAFDELELDKLVLLLKTLALTQHEA